MKIERILLLLLAITSCLGDREPPWRRIFAGADVTANASGAGVYPSLGQSGGYPGVRRLHAAAGDASGRLWVWGGLGHDRDAQYGALNDLWRFDTNTTTWTWLDGSPTADGAATYPAGGVGSAGGRPGARAYVAYAEAIDTDVTDETVLWLFGGTLEDNYLPASVPVWNDLWQLSWAPGNDSGVAWTWLAGSSLTNASTVYPASTGTPGQGWPGGRCGAVLVADINNDLYLFGGYGYGATGSKRVLNDVWRFRVSEGWTWLSGGTGPGTCGPQGQPHAASVTSREGAAGAALGGAMWLFGGLGADCSGHDCCGLLNGLWSFDFNTTHWTWVTGSSEYGAVGQYGAIGVPGGTPGGRKYVTLVADLERSRLLVHGGTGVDLTSSAQHSDMWTFNASLWQQQQGNASSAWTWVFGSSQTKDPGSWGVPKGRACHTLSPLGRGRFVLFGGADSELNLLNDVWVNGAYDLDAVASGCVSSVVAVESQLQYTGAALGSAAGTGCSGNASYCDTPLGCCALCSALGGCNAWTWNASSLRCYPKTGRGTPVSDWAALSGYYRQQTAEGATTQPSSAGSLSPAIWVVIPAVLIVAAIIVVVAIVIIKTRSKKVVRNSSFAQLPEENGIPLQERTTK